MDYLQSKWKLWFHSLDVNHDGKISFDDVEESRNKFTDLHKLLGDKASVVKVHMETWWNMYILKKTMGAELSEDQFVEQNKQSYNKDKAAYEKEIKDCFNIIFDVIDTDKDESIKLDEFIFAFKAFGHENEALITKTFELLQQEYGPFPQRDDVVAAWVSFVSNADSSKMDIIKKAFELGL